MTLKEKIQERAYFIWLDEGKPEGKSEEFWFRAEQEVYDMEISKSWYVRIEEKYPEVGALTFETVDEIIFYLANRVNREQRDKDKLFEVSYKHDNGTKEVIFVGATNKTKAKGHLLRTLRQKKIRPNLKRIEARRKLSYWY